jgi:hypothetical protein
MTFGNSTAVRLSSRRGDREGEGLSALPKRGGVY